MELGVRCGEGGCSVYAVEVVEDAQTDGNWKTKEGFGRFDAIFAAAAGDNSKFLFEFELCAHGIVGVIDVIVCCVFIVNFFVDHATRVG